MYVPKRYIIFLSIPTSLLPSRRSHLPEGISTSSSPQYPLLIVTLATWSLSTTVSTFTPHHSPRPTYVLTQCFTREWHDRLGRIPLRWRMYVTSLFRSSPQLTRRGMYLGLDFRQWIGGEQAIYEYCHDLAVQGGKRIAEVMGTKVLDTSPNQELTCAMVRLRSNCSISASNLNSVLICLGFVCLVR